MDKTRLIVVILSFLILVMGKSSGEPLTAKQGQVYKVENYFDVYRDNTNTATIDQVSQPSFTKNFTPYSYNFFSKDRDLTTWLKFSIYNPLPDPQNLFLSGGTNPDRSWKLFTQNAQGLFVENSPSRGFHVILFPLQISAHSMQEYYLKRFTEGKNTASNFVLEDPVIYALNAIDRYLVMGITYGIPLALLLHSLLIYILIRDKNYLVYIMMIACYLGFSILNDGLINRVPIFAVNNWWYLHMTEITIAGVGFFYCLFAKRVLVAEIYAPLTNYLMNFHLVLIIPILLFCIFFKAYEYVSLFYMFAAGVLAAILNIIVLSINYKPARYYFVGMMGLVFGSIIYFLVDFSLLQRNFFTENAVLFGVSFNVILQAIVLAARVNLFKEEEAKVKVDLINQKNLNVKIQSQAIKEQQQLIEAYERFVPHDFLELLQRKSIVDIQLGDEVEKEMSVLFADIRNFTTVLERKTTKESIQDINDYLSKVGPIIREYRGFVDKYIGDSIMAVFEQSPNDPIDVGIRMIKALRETRSENHSDNGESLEIGIGIHYGPLMMGIVGEKERMDGTVISDTVNTAFRLEELNKAYGTHIIISERVVDLINKEELKMRFLDHIYVKGKTQAIKIFEVFDADPPELIRKKIVVNSDFEKAIEYYRNRDFVHAVSYLKRCQKVLPNDPLFVIYLKRCEKYVREGCAEDWQPIIRLFQKSEFEF